MNNNNNAWLSKLKDHCFKLVLVASNLEEVSVALATDVHARLAMILGNYCISVGLQVEACSVTSSFRLYIATLPHPTLWRRGLDFWTQRNLGGTKIFQNQRGERGKGELLNFSLGEKIIGDETSNRKQNFRLNLKMFDELYNKLLK